MKFDEWWENHFEQIQTLRFQPNPEFVKVIFQNAYEFGKHAQVSDGKENRKTTISGELDMPTYNKAIGDYRVCYNKVRKEEKAKPYRMSKWKPSKINQSIEMTRCNFTLNHIEVRHLKWWEKIVYFGYILRNKR